MTQSEGRKFFDPRSPIVVEMQAPVTYAVLRGSTNRSVLRNLLTNLLKRWSLYLGKLDEFFVKMERSG
jgi:hypothetical protein